MVPLQLGIGLMLYPHCFRADVLAPSKAHMGMAVKLSLVFLLQVAEMSSAFPSKPGSATFSSLSLFGLYLTCWEDREAYTSPAEAVEMFLIIGAVLACRIIFKNHPELIFICWLHLPSCQGMACCVPGQDGLAGAVEPGMAAREVTVPFQHVAVSCRMMGD